MADLALLSHHGLALACIAQDPDARLRDIAECAGVTERSAHQLVSDLCAAGYIERSRQGRRNHYDIRADVPAGALAALSPARG
jgi:DNA-binding MarR family transcriptional regulator